ncbi:MAG: TonB-dependent receptor, partial [bacterium]|nr:TonB-dependent receptor [bacterium]
MRVVTAVLATFVLLFAFAEVHAAQAQSDSGAIEIVVSEAATHAPLAGARVILDGPFMAQEVTGGDGKVAFQAAPAGIYRAHVVKEAYAEATSEEFEVVGGRVTTVDVAMAKHAELRVIETITVSAGHEFGGHEITERSPLRRLSQSLAGALGKAFGVGISTGNGDVPTETISLEGHDPTQTALMLDGIPLSAPGQSIDLRSVDPDLFSSASIDFAPTAAALGGSVNLRTLEPTLTPKSVFTTMLDSNAGSASVLSHQATYDGLGVALVHAVRGNRDPLHGDLFRDTSGLSYVHHGARLSNGNLLKLRAHLGAAQTLTGTFLASNRYDDILCNLDTGALPCGYGPGNVRYGHFSFASLNDTALVGLVGVQLSLYAADDRNNDDLEHRVVAGVANPYRTETRLRAQGATLAAQLPSGGRHTLTLTATASRERITSSALAPSAAPFVAAPLTGAFSTLTLADAVRPNAHLRMTSHIGLSGATGAGSALLAGAGASWSATSRDALTASLDLGGAGASSLQGAALSDPAGLRFNCAAGLAFAAGPGDRPGRASSLTARIEYTHESLASGFQATLYHQVQHGTLIDALVSAPALPTSYFPPGYFAQAQQVFQSPGGCASGAAFGPQDLYVQLPIGGSTRVYEGMQLSALRSIAPHAIALLSYGTTVAKTIVADPRLLSGRSPTISGSQLPGVPLHRAFLALDYRSSLLPLDALLGVQYVSGNNPSNLPAYTTVDAGLALSWSGTTVTLLATNLFNASAGVFASPLGAVPLATTSGRPLPTVAFPLAPRTYSITLTMRTGARGAEERQPQLLELFPMLPHRPPRDPLIVDRTRSICDAPDAVIAISTTAALRSYIAAIESVKSSSGYPEQTPANAPAVPGITVVYHRLPNAYALTLSATSVEAAAALFRCVVVHFDTDDNAKALGLYIPKASPFARFTLTYSPKAGLYALRQPASSAHEEFRLYHLPAQPLHAPFAIEARPECEAELQPVAA